MKLNVDSLNSLMLTQNTHVHWRSFALLIVEGSAENQILVTINGGDFSSIEKGDDGGAIRLKKAGLICDNISFIGCQSNSDGDGGIYIRKDNENFRNEIELSNVSLSNCRAMYGGAIYIYSISEENYIEIIKLILLVVNKK